MWVSLCAGQVLFDTVYLLVEWTCASTKCTVRQNRKFQAQRDLQCLCKMHRCVEPRVHKNKSMQHHTLGSGTAEFQVTWPPKLREGTYLVKNVRARFEYRKTIAAHEKQVIMQEKAQPCASLWRKTLRPKRIRFLAIDAPIVDYVCLPLYHLTFLGSYQPLCEFSWRKKKEKAR